MSRSLVNLVDICHFVNGGTPSKAIPEYFSGDVPWISSADIYQSKIKNIRYRITKKAISESSANLVPKGTVLLVSRTGVGKVAIATEDLCFSQDITALLPRNGLDSKYLAHYLESKKDYFKKNSRGATIKGIARSIIEKLKIRLPSLAEQKRIAALLDKADALRQKNAEAQRLAADLVPAVFEEMFGGHERKFTKRLSDLAEIKIGPFGSLLHRDDYVASGVPLVNPSHIVDGSIVTNPQLTLSDRKISELEGYRLRNGDIVLARRGEIGRCAVVTNREEGYLCGTGSLFVRPHNQAYSEYLAKFLSSPQTRAILENGAVGVTMKNLNASTVGDLLVETPTLEQLKKFSERVRAISTVAKQLGERESLLQDIWQSITQDCFSS